MIRKFLLFIGPHVLKLVVKVRWHGFENFEIYDGPVIAAPNHIGRLDAVIPLMRPEVTRHPNLVVIVAEKYQESAILNWLVSSLGWMFIDRYNSDLRTTREVVRRVQDDGFLPIAPEGTRSASGALLEGKPGAVYVAAKTGALVYPTAIVGTDDDVAIPRLKRMRRAHAEVWLGEPFRVPPLPKKGKDEFLREWTDELMCRIAILLPEDRWGYYADHPRLKELLAGQATNAA